MTAHARKSGIRTFNTYPLLSHSGHVRPFSIDIMSNRYDCNVIPVLKEQCVVSNGIFHSVLSMRIVIQSYCMIYNSSKVNILYPHYILL